MSRLISAGVLAFEQADFFLAGSFNRVVGIQASGLQSWFFFNNQVLPWQVVDGSSVPDSSVSAGSVYFNEISAVPGFYNVRFFPDRVGFFRIVLLHPGYRIEVEKSFDSLPPGVLRPQSGGLIPSTGNPFRGC